MATAEINPENSTEMDASRHGRTIPPEVCLPAGSSHEEISEVGVYPFPVAAAKRALAIIKRLARPPVGVLAT